ncbi:protein ALP1-like [Xenia sp. Carnegie-2017]|uniref:protein ALP1-like n=1 Tax=Xenia sp. Carnegie-2017 TaxID=2897299 RepID=UPI001F0491BB|nr:protein ALP1-like [Xenia sp. Carnegie-2017]
MQPEYMTMPCCPEAWKKISDGFEKWNFPHCLGSIDGKHILIHGGSEYFNYKQRESIVLMAVVDASYKFITIDVGKSGSNSDGGIWESSGFGRALENGRVNLPFPAPLSRIESGEALPYMFVGDEAFPLRPYLMRPFPGRSLDNDSRQIFNYRLSRARRVVENAFGIMSHRWRILFKPIIAEPSKAISLVKAICVLHNFLRVKNDLNYTPPGFLDSVNEAGNITEGFWRTNAPNQTSTTGYNSRSATQQASQIREKLCTYFISSEGSVGWQWKHINRR